MKKALLYLFVFVAVQLIAAFAVQTVVKLWFPDINPASATVIMITSAVCSVTLITIFLGMKWYTVSRDYIRTRPWGVLFWTSILALGIIIPLTRLEELIPEAWMINLLPDEMGKILRTTEGYFVICMLAPLMEEILFRGAIIKALSEMENGKWRMKGGLLPVIISAIIFAIAHCNPAQMPHAFIVGIILGWLYMKTGSIVPGFILHWINNSAAYVLVNFFPLIPMDAKLSAYFGGNTSAVNQAVIFSLMIALPALYQLHLLLGRK